MKPIKFDSEKHIIFHYYEYLPRHPNGVRFIAFDEQGDCLASGDFFSIGGGFIVSETKIHKNGKSIFQKTGEKNAKQEQGVMFSAFPFSNAEELLQNCKRENMSIAQVVYQNELRWHNKEEIKKKVTDKLFIFISIISKLIL
jgi:hypothetical protein